MVDWLLSRIKVYLYKDKSVNYTIVDKIKTQLASTDFYQIDYKTNSILDKDVLKGVSRTNHNDFFKIERLQKVLTDKQIEKNRRFNDSLKKQKD
jgi:hypothetical protein